MNPQFRTYLREELYRLSESNPSYSLRAFARTLDYDFSSLSKILNGKRSLGPRTISYLGKKMNLSPDSIREFIYEEKMAGISKFGPKKGKEEFRPLSLDHIEIISDWYHFAILELIHTKGFRSSPFYIANSLGLTVLEAELAVARLKRVGLLRTTKQGDWVEKDNEFLTTTHHSLTSSALKNMQRQLLLKALRALDEVPLEDRDQSSITFAIDKKKLPLAKEKIKRFRRDLCKLMTKERDNDSVYSLTVSLFPITKKKGRT